MADTVDAWVLAAALDEAVAAVRADRTLSGMQIAEAWFRQPPEARRRVALLAAQALDAAAVERRRRCAGGDA